LSPAITRTAQRTASWPARRNTIRLRIRSDRFFDRPQIKKGRPEIFGRKNETNPPHTPMQGRYSRYSNPAEGLPADQRWTSIRLLFGFAVGSFGGSTRWLCINLRGHQNRSKDSGQSGPGRAALPSFDGRYSVELETGRDIRSSRVI